jgi:hypothetical protein
VLTLSNGDHLAGKLLSEANGTVTFHSDAVGDLTLTWDKITIQTANRITGFLPRAAPMPVSNQE